MKKNIIILTIASLLLVSCDKEFLTQEPILTQSSVLTLSDYDGLNAATAGIYAPFHSVNWYGASFVLNSELMGGNAKNPTNSDFTSGRYTVPYHWNFTPSTTSSIWSIAYYVISASNNVINNLEGKETSSVTIQDLNNLKAECLFLRSLAYFDLVRTFAQPYTHMPDGPGVPIVLVSEIGQPARNTTKEVYQRIVTDLTEAESIIEADYSRAEIMDVTDKAAVVSKEVIQALLSRVYLYMGDWQKSADYSTKVINSGKYSMFTADNLASQWGKNTAEEGGEIIYELYASQKNSYWGSWDMISYLTNPDGYADVASTADLRNMYEASDVRGKLFRSHPDAADHFWTLKYPVKVGLSLPADNNVVLIRLSEMYLNRAEAIYNGATISGVTADSDLLKITSNRGASPVSASSTTIFDERRKELAFEGHIFYDFARNKTSITFVFYDGTDVNKNIPFPSYKWAMPVPKAEIDANANIEQNENY